MEVARRDVYNREQTLEAWIECIRSDASLSEADREDILNFIDFLQKDERSSLRTILYIQVLLRVKKVIRRPFRECTKEDIQHYINYLEDKGYRPSTLLTYKSIIKKFFKVVYGNNEYYPDAVRWIKLKVSKDKQREEEQLSYDQFLTEDEIKLLIDTASTIGSVNLRVSITKLYYYAINT